MAVNKSEPEEKTTSATISSSTTPSSTAKTIIDISPDESDRKENNGQITGLRLWVVVLGITLVAFLIMLDQTVLVTAIPKITTEFNSIDDVGWYGSAYLLSTAALQPLTGKLYQFYRSKLIFISCVAIFELGSLLCGVSISSNMFIVGRAIAGVGSAGLTTGLLTIISSSVPIEKRPLYLGIVVGTASIGTVLGPVLGGLLTQHASWRWCFYINLPCGGVTILTLLLVRIPDTKAVINLKTTYKEHLRRLDLFGFASFTPAIIMLLLAVQWGGIVFPWGSATIIGLLCGSAGVFLVFGVIEKWRGEEEAMLPLSMLRKRVMLCASITTFTSSGANLLVSYYLPVWFQVVLNVSPTRSGVYFLPTVAATVLSSVLTGVLVNRTGFYIPFAILGAALAVAGYGLLTTLTPHSGAAMWVSFQIVAGITRGLSQQPGITAIQTVLPPAKVSIGNAFAMFSQMLGGALFLAFGQTLFSNELLSALEYFAPTVDAAKIFAVGATEFRTVVETDQVANVIMAYNRALTRVYYLGIGASSLGFVVSWGLGWTNLKTFRSEKLENTAPTTMKE